MTTFSPANLRNAPPQVAMMMMLGGYRVARAVWGAASIDLAAHLADGPRPIAELAKLTDTDSDALYRLMRALASVGVFVEEENGYFALAEVGECLSATAPDSALATVAAFGDPWHWQLWGDLTESVRTGAPAFDRRYGCDFFTYCQTHPELARRVNQSKTSVFGASEAAILDAYDFSGLTRLVEVGYLGGYGSLLAGILRRYPAAKGVLYDLPVVVEGAADHLAALGLGERLTAVAGDCLAQVMEGGDAYLLKGVLHNWDDERVLQCLGHCREAMDDGARLLVCEMPMPPGNDLFVGKFIDIESLLLTPGGRERTAEEWRGLIEAAGFRVSQVVPTAAPIAVIEALPA